MVKTVGISVSKTVAALPVVVVARVGEVLNEESC